MKTSAKVIRYETDRNDVHWKPHKAADGMRAAVRAAVQDRLRNCISCHIVSAAPAERREPSDITRQNQKINNTTPVDLAQF